MADITLAQLKAVWDATNTKLDTLLTKDFATQTTLAAVLARLIKECDYVQDSTSTPEEHSLGQTWFQTDTGKVVISNGTIFKDYFTPNSSTNPDYVKTQSRKKITGSVTIGTGAAHHANDVVSTDTGAIGEFDLSTILSAGGSGILLSTVLTIDQNAAFSGCTGYYLYLFSVAPTAQATNEAFNLDSTDEDDNCLGVAEISIPRTLSSSSECCMACDIGHNLDFNLAAADTKIYWKLVCKGAETTVSGKVIAIKPGIIAA